jgi:cobalt-precorrin-5B (C1)-methyltransferase
VASLAGGGAEIVDAILRANTAAEALALAGREALPLAALVAEAARSTAKEVLGAAPVSVNVMIVDRDGRTLAETGFA